nr:retrovirus-related Pol polyprotein from transposon TNT 1-94 [Tanacetum cinerariifolium]
MPAGRKISEHIDEFNKIVLDLANIEVKFEDEDLALLLLTSLPASYEHFMDTLLYGREALTLKDMMATLNSKEIKERSPSPLHNNPLSGSTTYFSSLNPLLEEFADELPLKYDDNLQFDIESNLKVIEFLLYQDKDSSLKDSIDQKNLANLADIFVATIPEMFTDEHALDYSSPPIFDEYDDDFLEVESDAENVYDDPFDSKGEKIKEVDAFPSTNNEDKIFNPGILIQEKPVEIITRVDKKLAISNASLVLEDFDPPFYEPLFFKEVPKSKTLLPFSSENEEKVFKPGIHTSEKVHSSLIPELSRQGYKVFKINKIFKSLMKIFLFYCGKDTHILVVPCHHFYPLDQFNILGNVKTHAEGFCLPVFIFSASIGNHVSKSNQTNVYLMAYFINGLRFT